MSRRDTYLLFIVLLSIPMVLLAHYNMPEYDFHEMGAFVLNDAQLKPLAVMFMYSLYPWFTLYFFLKYKATVMDWYRVRTEKSFTEFRSELKEKILERVFCPSCLDYYRITFKKEEKVNSMRIIYGICSECKNEVKTRIE